MANERLYSGIQRPQYTPEHIDSLREDEVFVFGSNLAGMHGGGAAYAAFKLFGAVMGCGVGLRGQSYAIPTMQGGVETIKPYVDDFIAFAKEHPELFFFVTRIGCGIAGFRDKEIAPLFPARLWHSGALPLLHHYQSLKIQNYDEVFGNGVPGRSIPREIFSRKESRKRQRITAPSSSLCRIRSCSPGMPSGKG